MFTNFTITVISESMKSMEKLSGKISDRKVVKFYTYMLMSKKKEKLEVCFNQLM